MFIWVGESSEQLSPIASVARLQLLDQCDVGDVYSYEISGHRSAGDGVLPSFPTPKDIWVVLDRKLRAVLNDTGVKSGETIDEIVKSGAQAVGDFADQNTDDLRGRILTRLRPMLSDLFLIQMLGSKLSLRLLKRDDLSVKVRQVFLCPFDSLESALEGAGQGFFSREYDLTIDRWGEDEASSL